MAVLRRVPDVDRLATELVDAGIGVIEVTLDDEGALAGIERLRERGTVAVLAGTVRTVEQAEAAVAAGAEALVSPVFSGAVLARGHQLGVPVIPGALTPTEIEAAWRAGAAMVKLFPARAVGPEYVADVLKPLQDVPLVCTGGVSAANAGRVPRRRCRCRRHLVSRRCKGRGGSRSRRRAGPVAALRARRGASPIPGSRLTRPWGALVRHTITRAVEHVPMRRITGLERQELAACPDNPSRGADLVHVPRPRRPAFGEQVDDVSLHRLEDGHTRERRGRRGRVGTPNASLTSCVAGVGRSDLRQNPSCDVHARGDVETMR